MTVWIKKRFIFALILCLGMMQLLLPFLHTHHDGDVVHAKSQASLLHIHEIQRNALTMHLSLDDVNNLHTALVDRGFEAAIVGVDDAVPSQQEMNLDLIAILIAIICLIALSNFIHYEYFSNFKQAYSNRRPLSRAPPKPYQ